MFFCGDWIIACMSDVLMPENVQKSLFSPDALGSVPGDLVIKRAPSKTNL